MKPTYYNEPMKPIYICPVCFKMNDVERVMEVFKVAGKTSHKSVAYCHYCEHREGIASDN